MQWELSDRFDDVALVVSELVTNALRHACPRFAGETPSPRDALRNPQDPAVRLHLTRWAGRLVCAVRDPSDDSPATRESEEDFAAESGRGLFLVDSFSDGWGWHPLAGSPHDKLVWALFLLDY
jgi:anti-sigma regulatory factor (Ser/Thr protein kinase)